MTTTPAPLRTPTTCRLCAATVVAVDLYWQVKTGKTISLGRRYLDLDTDPNGTVVVDDDWGRSRPRYVVRRPADIAPSQDRWCVHDCERTEYTMPEQVPALFSDEPPTRRRVETVELPEQVRDITEPLHTQED